MKIIQHIPNFVEGVERQFTNVTYLSELEAVPWIRKWMDEKNFFRLSIDKKDNLLMAEFNSGEIWYVIGTVVFDKINLPEWKPKTIYC